MVEVTTANRNFIINQARFSIGQRINMMNVLPWAEKSFNIPYLLDAVDENIRFFNGIDPLNIPSQLQNSLELYQILGQKKLPTYSGLLISSETDANKVKLPAQFKLALKRMNVMMKVGETFTAPNRPYYLKYHTTTQSPYVLAVGTAYHLYEELIKLHIPEIRKLYDQGLVRPDLVVDALLEVLMYKKYVLKEEMENSDSLLGPLIDDLNWIRGYEGFHPDILAKIPAK